MEKSNQKQKALELFRAGHSYGEIAKQIGEAKSTVYRWIKEEEENYGTSRTPSGTGFGTDKERNETGFETSLHKEIHTGTLVPQNLNEFTLDSNKLAQVEMRKSELKHEFRMAELDFRQKQYMDERKLEQSEKDTEQLQSKLETIVTELTDLKNQNQELSQKMAEKNTSEEKEFDDKSIPRDIYIKIKKIIKKYFSFDKNLGAEEELDKMHHNSQQIRLEIYHWAHKNKIHFSEIKDLSYFNELIHDIGDSLQSIEKVSDEPYLVFDQTFKMKMKNWIKDRL